MLLASPGILLLISPGLGALPRPGFVVPLASVVSVPSGSAGARRVVVLLIGIVSGYERTGWRRFGSSLIAIDNSISDLLDFTGVQVGTLENY